MDKLDLQARVDRVLGSVQSDKSYRKPDKKGNMLRLGHLSEALGEGPVSICEREATVRSYIGSLEWAADNGLAEPGDIAALVIDLSSYLNSIPKPKPVVGVNHFTIASPSPVGCSEPADVSKTTLRMPKKPVPAVRPLLPVYAAVAIGASTFLGASAYFVVRPPVVVQKYSLAQEHFQDASSTGTVIARQGFLNFLYQYVPRVAQSSIKYFFYDVPERRPDLENLLSEVYRYNGVDERVIPDSVNFAAEPNDAQFRVMLRQKGLFIGKNQYVLQVRGDAFLLDFLKFRYSVERMAAFADMVNNGIEIEGVKAGKRELDRGDISIDFANRLILASDSLNYLLAIFGLSPVERIERLDYEWLQKHLDKREADSIGMMLINQRAAVLNAGTTTLETQLSKAYINRLGSIFNIAYNEKQTSVQFVPDGKIFVLSH